MAGPAVVELFTSEGCNSCPPAEAVLGSLAGRPDVLALAFHVTYWDSVSWRDSFGLAEAAGRQYRYVRRLGLASAYTPQVVVDGRVDVLGSQGDRIAQAVAQLPRPVRFVAVRSARGLEWRLPHRAGGCPCDLLLASVRQSARVLVRGGENGGRTLEEPRIVRRLTPLGTWDGVATDRTVPLSGLPADATSFVLLAQGQQEGAIVGAGEAVR